MQRRNGSDGFTLIEMMVAVGLLGLLSAGMMMVFSGQKRVYVANERVLEVQEDARLVVDLMVADARMAGFMVPPKGAIVSVDGGAADADRLCISESAYISSSALNTMDSNFDGAQVISVSGNTIGIESLNIDGADPNCAAGVGNDFVDCAGNVVGVILSDSATNRTWCGMLTAVNPLTGTLLLVDEHAIPGGTFPVLSNVSAVPAIVYEVTPPSSLTRNEVLLSTAIEDLQVRFWVDDASNPPNGVIDTGAVPAEFPVDTLGVGGFFRDPSLIRRVQISVIARSSEADTGGRARFDAQPRPANANRLADSVVDNFRRKTFSTSVMPRNLAKTL